MDLIYRFVAKVLPTTLPVTPPPATEHGLGESYVCVHKKLHVACLRICVTTCDRVALHTQNGGMLTADGNSAPHVAAANLPLFPNCGSSTPCRGEKVRYRRVDDEGATFSKIPRFFSISGKNFPLSGWTHSCFLLNNVTPCRCDARLRRTRS